MKLTKEVKIMASIVLVVLLVSLGVFLFAKKAKEESAPGLASSSVTNDLTSFSLGPVDAKVEVTEFFDPECESCKEVDPYIKGEIKYYNTKVRWVFRYMAYHPNSVNAIRVLEAARKQNLFQEAKEALFLHQHEWGMKHDGSDTGGSKEEMLISIVSSLSGINIKKLREDMKDPNILRLIEKDKREGTSAGVTGTPTLFVNGKIIDPLSLDEMIKRIDAALK